MPDATQDDESTWLVNMTVEAGSNTPIVPVGAESGSEAAESETETEG